MCGGLASFTKNRHRSCVALARGALHMVRAFGRECTAGCERFGAPLMCAHSPRRRRRLVDGPPDEWVPEAKAAWHVGLANEVEVQQLVYGTEN